jgi:Rrf2 family protein
VYVSAKADYALRALLQVAARDPEHVSMAEIVSTQQLPRSFAEAILPELRRADFLHVRRGGTPGYTLARPAAEITIGAVVRFVDGPLTRVRGRPPADITYPGAARRLSALWLSVSAGLDRLLDGVTLADLLTGQLAADVVPIAGRGARSIFPADAGNGEPA